MRCTLGATLTFVSLLSTSGVAAQETYTTTLEVRIGALDGADALTRVSAVMPLADGRTLVVQPMETVIRLFDRDGGFVRSIGRRGDGPGEMRRITGAGIRGDSVWITDAGSRRLSLFDLNGTLLRSVGWTAAGRYVPARYLADGTFTANIVVELAPGQEALDLLPRGHWPIMRFGSDGNPIDTLMFVDARPRHITIGGRSVRNPIHDGALSSFSPAGDLVAVVDRRAPTSDDRHQFAITWIGVSGDTLRTRRYEYSPVPLSDRQVETLAAAYRASGAPAQYVSDAVAAIRSNSFLPPVTQTVVAADSAVWFTREAAVDAQERNWYRATPEDGITGEVVLPPRSRIVNADGSRIWVVEQDELDVSYVARYRFRQASGRSRIHTQQSPARTSSCGAPTVLTSVRSRCERRGERRRSDGAE